MQTSWSNICYAIKIGYDLFENKIIVSSRCFCSKSEWSVKTSKPKSYKSSANLSQSNFHITKIKIDFALFDEIIAGINDVFSKFSTS